MKHCEKQMMLTDADLLNTGPDITQTWKKAKTSISLSLSSDKGIEELSKYLKEVLHPSNFDIRILEFTVPENLYHSLDFVFKDPDIKKALFTFLESPMLSPNKISPARLIITEALFQAFNKRRAPVMFDHFLLHTLQLFSKICSELWPNGKFNLSEIQDGHIDKVLDIFWLDAKKHPVVFKTGFAFALRQSSLADVQYFLDFQEEQYLPEANFLIFLDGLIKEFHEIFEPKTLKEVEKWLEQKQTILEEAGAEMFSFSKDITNNREEALVNMETFKADHSYTSEFQKKLLRKKALEDYYRHKRDRKNLARAILSLELDQIFLKTEQHEEIVRLIEGKPFDIFPEAISFIEKVNFISTRDMGIFDPIYRKEKAYLERKNASLRQSLKGNLDAFATFHQEWVAEPLKSTDPDFAFFFAYALRQIPRKQLRAFLNHQLRFYPQPVRVLLEDTLADFEHIFEPRCKAFIQQWMIENDQNLTLQSSRAGDSQSEKEGFIKIKGKLTHEQVTEAFQDVFNRTGLNKERPFLNEADISALCKIGLAYPKEEPAIKPFHLHISSGCKDKFFGLIYELYDQNTIPGTRSGSKKDFARFLKYNFTGFESQSIERIANYIRRPRVYKEKRTGPK